MGPERPWKLDWRSPFWMTQQGAPSYESPEAQELLLLMSVPSFLCPFHPFAMLVSVDMQAPYALGLSTDEVMVLLLSLLPLRDSI